MPRVTRRVGSEDLTLTVRAIETARQTGGSLTEVFEKIAATMATPEATDVKEVTKAFIQLANDGGGHDNITSVVVRVAENGASVHDAVRRAVAASGAPRRMKQTESARRAMSCCSGFRPGRTRAGIWKQTDLPPPVGMSTTVS